MGQAEATPYRVRHWDHGTMVLPGKYIRHWDELSSKVGRKQSQHSHLADMAILMVPRLRSGKYLNVMRESDVDNYL